MGITQQTLDFHGGTANDVRAMKLRLTTLERQISSNAASEMGHYSSVMERLDQFDNRLVRVESQLGLSNA
jgi:hypothetical protein